MNDHKLANNNPSGTPSNAKAFACLRDYNIFYRWRRNSTKNRLSSCNRKSMTGDKTEPPKVNKESDSQLSVRHLIILKPKPNNHENYINNASGPKGMCIILSYFNMSCDIN